MSSLNRVILIGSLGKDPDIHPMKTGDRVCNFSLATSESYKDKSGERVTKTEWHKVVIFNQNLVKVAESYLKKGSKVYVEGQIETRKWNKDGQDVFSTEIVLRPYRGEIVLLDSKEKSPMDATKYGKAPSAPNMPVDDFEDSDMPF